MSTQIRVGLIGLGAIGATHALALDALRPDAQLAAFSGGSASADAIAPWPGASRREPQDVLADPTIDVIAVCSPSDLHAEHTLSALDAGKHVVVEKPLALTAGDADRIVASAERADRHVSVMAQRRFEPEVQAVRAALDDGSLGAVRLISTQVNWWRDENYYRQAAWRGDPAQGGGSLMNQGVHNVDLLQWLGGGVADVTAQSATLAHRTEAEDTTVATLRLAAGGLGFISTSTATPPGAPATLALHCERGTVEIGQGELLRWDVDGVNPPEISAARAIGVGSSDPAAIGVAGHVNQWRDVIASLQEGRAPAITARDGAATVRLIRAIQAARAEGRQVRTEDAT